MSAWSATVLTLFPEMFPGPLGISLLGKALEKGLWSLEVRDNRDHGLGKHRTVDDTPAGGGIVADSQEEAEYQETVNKSKALLAAAEEAVRFASAAKKGQ